MTHGPCRPRRRFNLLRVLLIILGVIVAIALVANLTGFSGGPAVSATDPFDKFEGTWYRHDARLVFVQDGGGEGRMLVKYSTGRNGSALYFNATMRLLEPPLAIDSDGSYSLNVECSPQSLTYEDPADAGRASARSGDAAKRCPTRIRYDAQTKRLVVEGPGWYRDNPGAQIFCSRDRTPERHIVPCGQEPTV